MATNYSQFGDVSSTAAAFSAIKLFSSWARLSLIWLLARARGEMLSSTCLTAFNISSELVQWPNMDTDDIELVINEPLVMEDSMLRLLVADGILDLDCPVTGLVMVTVPCLSGVAAR